MIRKEQMCYSGGNLLLIKESDKPRMNGVKAAMRQERCGKGRGRQVHFESLRQGGQWAIAVIELT